MKFGFFEGNFDIIQAGRLEAVTEIAVALGLSSLILAVTEIMNKENKKEKHLFKDFTKLVNANKSQENSVPISSISQKPLVLKQMKTSSEGSESERLPE